MKFPCLPALALLAATLLAPAALRAADHAIEFNGVIVQGDVTKVSLLNSVTGEASWVAIGRKFSSYTVTSFSATSSVVVLTDASGITRNLTLQTAPIVNALSPVAPTANIAPGLAEPAIPAPGTPAYVVSAGDTLALIAKRNGITVKELVEANSVADPSKLRVGQKLIIPGGKPAAN